MARRWIPGLSIAQKTRNFVPMTGTQVQQILCTLPSATGSTAINTIAYKGEPGLITNTYILQILHPTCSSFGGKATFGLDSHEIGNKSIRSGAVMALFINNISTAKS
jgi:hypothetical protein